MTKWTKRVLAGAVCVFAFSFAFVTPAQASLGSGFPPEPMSIGTTVTAY